MDRLRNHAWPGNVRQLHNVLEGVVVLSRKEVIELADLPPEVQNGKKDEATAPFRRGVTLAEMEREAIGQCLLDSGGNRQRTAELLGISTRTLLRKIKKYRLEHRRRPAEAVSDERSSR
jgi:DNA-binding NtrC family response regulator